MTPKKIDKRKLAAKLEEITENISTRGIYIAVSSGGFYNIIDYVTKTAIVNEVPDRDIADKLATRMNHYKKLPAHKIKKAHELVNGLHKYGNDMEFYRNIIRKTDDEVKKDTAIMRLNLARQYLEKLIRDVSKI